MSAPASSTNYTSLAGKVAIVTGGSSGIGASTVRRLSAAGASVMINYHSNAAEADALATELGTSTTATVQADAGSIDGIQKIVDATVARFGKIDIAIANAAVMLIRDLASTTPEDFTRSFTTNVQGPYFLAQRVVPHMPPEGGRIIFLSTSLVKNSGLAPHYLLYNSTKGAIDQMTRIIARELGDRNITVNAVAPGPTGTELFFKGKSEQVLDMIRKQSPQNRIGTPEEIADVIAFVAGPESRWVSGQTLFVNGASIV